MIPVVHQQDLLAVVAGNRRFLLNDQGAKQAVAVLNACMGVVPMRAPRRGREVVGERLTGRNRRTGDAFHPIHLPGARLVHAVPVDDRGHLQVVLHREVEAFPFLHPDGGANQLAAVAIHPSLHAIGCRLKHIGTQALARPPQGNHGLAGAKGTAGREQVETGGGGHPQAQGGEELATTHHRIEETGVSHGFGSLPKVCLITSG